MSYLTDPRGNPSRWVALGLAVMFAIATVVVATRGGGADVTGVLAGLFLVAFNVAFGKRGLAAEIASVFARRPTGTESSPSRPS